MREEISEPQQWRAHRSKAPNWTTRQQAAGKPLPAELVDAALAEDGPLAGARLDAGQAQQTADIEATSEANDYRDLLVRLSEQLTQLEAQRGQLQRLLDQAADQQS